MEVTVQPHDQAQPRPGVLRPTPGSGKAVMAGPFRLVPSLYQVALLAVLGAVFLVGLAPQLDTDLWWHLKVGSYIWSQHVVPARDFMSYTYLHHPWTDHEWLAELLLYGLYRLGGLWGPIGFFAGVICATYGFVYAHMASRGVNRILALFVLCAAFIAAYPALGARPQMGTLFFLSVYALVLHRFQQTRNRRLLLLLPALMLLWTNLHGGFVLGLVVIALTLMGETLNRLTGSEEALNRDDLHALLLTLLAALAVTLLNPNGIRSVLYPLVWILPTAYSNSLTEWVSVDFHMPLMMVFEGMLLLLIVGALLSRARLNCTHLLMLVVFTHLALSQDRNVSVWTVLLSPLLALYLQESAPALRQFFPGFTGRTRRYVRGPLVPVLNLMFLVLIVLVYAAETLHYINPKALHENEVRNYPAQAVAYMKSHQLPPNVFVSYAWGGYVLWNLYPSYRDFIDGRANTLFSSETLYAYLDAYDASPRWRMVLDRYRVQDVLVEAGAPLAQVLTRDKGWRLVHRDDLAVLFARR